jgi:hypothetical protein
VEFLTQLGADFTDYFDSIHFDWKRLAGARVLEIGGRDPYAYVDHIADTASGNYLDHNVRVNLVFSSYRISSYVFSQRIGDLAGSIFVTQTSLSMRLLAVNSIKSETVDIPYLASLIGENFTDTKSLFVWYRHCNIILCSPAVPVGPPIVLPIITPMAWI